MCFKYLPAAALLGVFCASIPASAQSQPSGAAVLRRLNTNPGADRTLDWREISPAAVSRFKELDVDHDGTLTREEAAKAGIGAGEFDRANAKGTHTLSQQEYLNLVRARFKAANQNPNADQTLDSRELSAPAGQDLIKLLKLGD